MRCYEILLISKELGMCLDKYKYKEVRDAITITRRVDNKFRVGLPASRLSCPAGRSQHRAIDARPEVKQIPCRLGGKAS